MKTLLLMFFTAGITAAATLYATQQTNHPILERFHPTRPVKQAIPWDKPILQRPDKPRIPQKLVKVIKPFKPTPPQSVSTPNKTPSSPTQATLEKTPEKKTEKKNLALASTKTLASTKILKTKKIPKKTTHVDYARLNHRLFRAANALERFNQRLLAETRPAAPATGTSPQEKQP